MKALALGPRFRKRCPTCNRPEDDPESYSRTDRLLSTVFTNPVVAFMRMHNYAGPGGILELSDRFVRFLDRAQPLSRRQAELLVEVLTEYAHDPPIKNCWTRSLRIPPRAPRTRRARATTRGASARNRGTPSSRSRIAWTATTARVSP
jgi:hypothetical protein